MGTADFTIGPKPLTIVTATATDRAYEKGNTTVDISGVTFKNKAGEDVPLTLGTDYTASGTMDDANAGDGKTVTVELKNSNYTFKQDGEDTDTATITTTVNIGKAAALPTQSVRIVGRITIEDHTGVKMIIVNQSVKYTVPDDASVSGYQGGTPIMPEGVTVPNFSASGAGLVTATLKGVEQSTQGDDSKNVTLPVIVSSANYEDSTIDVVVVPKDKTYMEVSIGEYEKTKTYGDGTFTLTASVPTATNAGEYTVWCKVAGDENHSDTDAQRVEVYVGKADPPGVAPSLLLAQYSAKLGDVTIPAAENGTWSWEEPTIMLDDFAGLHNCAAMFTPTDTTNYNTIEGVLVTVIAAKGKSSVTKAPAANALSYNGEAQELVTAGTAEGGTMEYSLDGEDFIEDIPVGADEGEYTVWYMVAGDENHEDSAPASVKVTIGPAAIGSVAMHRLYNPNSGEHFYTASEFEYNSVVAAGWSDEGTGWTAPETSNTPVYRLYNANGGEHHYTMSTAERDMLVGVGWFDEGIGWYSDDAEGVALHREYNPNAFSCNHNYTTSTAEHEWLLSLGWRDEGTAWYGVAK